MEKRLYHGTQNYLITYDPFGDTVGRANLNIVTNTGKIKMVKNDAETNKPIEGVTFQLSKADGTIIANATTNKNGETSFSNLYQGNYILKEISTDDNYILNETNFNVNVEYNKTSEIVITNEHKRGNLKIYKVDKDNNKVGLGNVKFDLFSQEFNRVIGTYTTNVNGELYIENIRTGNYKLIEKETNKWYNLASDTDVKVEWNTTSENTITNELKKGQIRVIKVDLDNNEVKLEGVKFNVLDKNNRILETIITDSKGEALTSRYAIRDYENLTLQEVETDERYVLNNKTQTIKLEQDQIKNLTFTNEKKKGQVQVIKVDLDNNEVKLPNVEFNVLDESGNIIDKLVTDENGEAVSKRLPIDQRYTLQETKTLNNYVLNEETQTVILTQDQITDITFTNEKKKGQIKVIKIDFDNNEVKIPNVEFNVLDSKGNIVDKLVTDSNGEAVSKRLPIDEQYILQETKTLENYVLNEETQTVTLTQDQITDITFINEKVKGQIEVIKTSEDDNQYSGLPAGTPLKDFIFEVYNADTNELVDSLITGEDGKAITKRLVKGKYFIIEKETGNIYYLKNDNRFDAEIKENNQIVSVDITDESINPSVDIEKDGIIQTTANQEIKYTFDLKNTGNVPLNNFTWTDTLPTDYVRITRLVTGTYNQDLNYDIYYKTNKNDYKLLVGNLSTQVNNYVDFTNLELAEDEYVTDFKVEFGTVDVGFQNVIKPYIFTTVNSSVEAEDTFTNKTRIEGKNSGIVVWDEDNHTTKVYEKEITIKKLPRTGR